MSLSFTGERFLPECQGEMVYEHWHRYLFAQGLASGLRVLDVASGEGYGSHLLAQKAREVVGVDLAAEAVEHARARYAQANLRYLQASCTSIPLPDASFDLIVSFETIEHIHEQEAFLKEIDRLLAPEGLVIISSPNRPEYSDKTGYQNEFHVRELDRTEFAALLDRHWSAQRWYGQRAAFHSLLWPLEAPAQAADALAIDGQSAWPEPMYFLVMASRSEARLAELQTRLSLVTDRDNSVYAEWSRTYRENEASRQEIERLRAELERLRTDSPVNVQPSAAPTTPATYGFWAKLFGRRR